MTHTIAFIRQKMSHFGAENKQVTGGKKGGQ